MLKSCWLCAGMLLLVGCGGSSGPEMVDISGVVTYQGEPIKDGAIRFIPKPGTEARVTPVTIVDGKYAAEGDTGLAVGSYTVEFHSYDIAPASESADPAMGGEVMPGMEIKKELLPDKYSKDSVEEITIESGSDAITKDFNLE